MKRLKNQPDVSVLKYMRIGVRIALAAYIGYFMYSLLVFFWGFSGIIASKQLSDHREELLHNIVSLETIQDELASNRDQLLYDNDEIRLLARKLGYLESDQYSVVIDGVDRKRVGHTLGRVIRSLNYTQPNLTFFRAIGFSVALLSIICVLLFGMKRRDRTI